jgi:AcrR family transcriptional regulator
MLRHVMARPANADAAATRARILESAVTLFARHGVGTTSVRDIAGAAGVSLAMVGHYFGSKDELYEASIEAVYTELAAMNQQLGAELVAAGSPRELLSRPVVVAFQFARKHRAAVRLLVRSAVSTGEVHPRGRRLLMTALDVVTTALGARLGRPPGELRLALQSVVFLVARYAAQDERELAAVVGVPIAERRRAVEAVEAHLVELALGLFGLSGAAAAPEREQQERQQQQDP